MGDESTPTRALTSLTFRATSVRANVAFVQSPLPVGDVAFALHFDQSRDRALEFEGVVAGGVDLLGRRRGRGYQQGARLVEGVDQDAEAPGGVALVG